MATLLNELDEQLLQLEERIKTSTALLDFADIAWKTSKNKGFHEPGSNDTLAAQIVNMHAELSELWEAVRNNTLHDLCQKAQEMSDRNIKPLTCAEEELADLLIRALDTAQQHNICILSAVRAKMQYNLWRTFRHGGKTA